MSKFEACSRIRKPLAIVSCLFNFCCAGEIHSTNNPRFISSCSNKPLSLIRVISKPSSRYDTETCNFLDLRFCVRNGLLKYIFSHCVLRQILCLYIVRGLIRQYNVNTRKVAMVDRVLANVPKGKGSKSIEDEIYENEQLLNSDVANYGDFLSVSDFNPIQTGGGWGAFDSTPT